MARARPGSERWDALFPEKPPAYQLGDRLRRLVRRWEAMPCNRPGSDKTWVERSISEHAAVVRAAVRPR